MHTVKLETQASVEAGENGALYWNAMFIPELCTILEVVAMDEQDFKDAVELYKQNNIFN
jgi:capsular polysaccharide biosynthesis protein